MQAMPPKVTIIIPTYNRAALLKIAMLSVLDCHYPNLECIVVDNASGADTTQVVEALQAQYPGQILYLRSEQNRGESSAINWGLSKAQGEYLLTLSDDDFLLPNWFDISVPFMENHPDIIAAYPDWHIVDAQGRRIKTIYMVDYSFTRLFTTCANIPGPGVIIRKSAVMDMQHLRNPEYRYSPDYAMWLTLATKGLFAHIPQVTACWRRHEKSLSVCANGYSKASEMETMIQHFISQHQALPVVGDNSKKLKVRAFLHIVYVLCRGQDFYLAAKYACRAFLMSPYWVCVLAGCYMSRILRGSKRSSL